MKELYKPVMKFVAMLLVTMILALGGCGIAYKEQSELSKKTKYEATLVEAYSTFENCGYKGRSDCQIFIGRLVLDKGGQIDKELDGFLYHSFIKNGEKPERAVVTLTPRDFGQCPTLYGLMGFLIGVIGLVLLMLVVVYGICDLPEKLEDLKRSNKIVR